MNGGDEQWRGVRTPTGPAGPQKRYDDVQCYAFASRLTW
jgi:hypothetical protein